MDPDAEHQLGADVKWNLSNIPTLAKRFVIFRGIHFVDPKGNPYRTPDFQVRWIKSLLRSLMRGGKLSILSPPRHGKTDLLAHVVIWLLIRDPNLRILWVGGNSVIAEKSLGQVRDELEFNESLQEKFLPPTSSFKPSGRSGKAWSTREITLANRTHTGIRSPSIAAVGRRGRLLSRDADIIITDDIEDHDSTQSPQEREATKNWWTHNLSTRKEEHTAWWNIGSRQHPDDIHVWLAESPAWQSIIEQAHNPECDKPTHWPNDNFPDESYIPEDEHTPDCPICKQHKNCVLFPGLRTYFYLMEQLKDVRLAKFNMVYQNNPEEVALAPFKKKSINACMNHERGFGLTEIPKDENGVRFTKLIGGLDPSASNYQASFLWAFNKNNTKLYCVDAENKKGGGIAEARRIIREWFEKYDLRHWVVEENLYHGGIIHDDQIRDFCARNHIILEGHQTYAQNKWDESFGVTTMADWFDSQSIDLPFKASAKPLIQEYRKQLINFNPNIKISNPQRRKYASDLVMAAWFPYIVLKRQFVNEQMEILMEHEGTEYPELSLGDLYEEISI